VAQRTGLLFLFVVLLLCWLLLLQLLWPAQLGKKPKATQHSPWCNERLIVPANYSFPQLFAFAII
jgi:hypothetical protein